MTLYYKKGNAKTNLLQMDHVVLIFPQRLLYLSKVLDSWPHPPEQPAHANVSFRDVLVRYTSAKSSKSLKDTSVPPLRC